MSFKAPFDLSNHFGTDCLNLSKLPLSPHCRTAWYVTNTISIGWGWGWGCNARHLGAGSVCPSVIAARTLHWLGATKPTTFRETSRADILQRRREHAEFLSSPWPPFRKQGAKSHSSNHSIHHTFDFSTRNDAFTVFLLHGTAMIHIY